MKKYDVVVFYVELLIYLDGEETSIYAVGSSTADCTDLVYADIALLESLGHSVVVDEYRMGIL